MAGDLERDFCNQVALEFFLDARGITGYVRQSGQDIEIVGKVDSAGVAELSGGYFSAIKNFFRE